MTIMTERAPLVVVSGASGLIGTALLESLRADGIAVRRLVRRPPATPEEVRWQPGAPLDPAQLAGATAIVNLSGAGVGDHRWTERYKQEILDSRVGSTDTLARAAAAMDEPPAVLVNASAIGYYGDTADREVDEASPVGEGFLAEVVQAWEAAAAPAVQAGIRVALPRTGLVVSGRGGAWQRLFPIFRAGVGGRLGSGRQYWSWISLRDEVAALRFLIDGDLAGPVNLVAPRALTNREVTEAMGEVLGRPTVLPVPGFALKAVLGEFSSEVLGSIRVRPGVLTDAGFTWQDPGIETALAAARAGW
jgi:uncharacterized protein (TIGR01777 family)